VLLFIELRAPASLCSSSPPSPLFMRLPLLPLSLAAHPVSLRESLLSAYRPLPARASSNADLLPSFHALSLGGILVKSSTVMRRLRTMR
jgi:hypothetical protein